MRTKQEIRDELARLELARDEAAAQAANAQTAYGVRQGWLKADEANAKIVALRWALGESPTA